MTSRNKAQWQLRFNPTLSECIVAYSIYTQAYTVVYSQIHYCIISHAYYVDMKEKYNYGAIIS